MQVRRNEGRGVNRGASIANFGVATGTLPESMETRRSLRIQQTGAVWDGERSNNTG